MKFLFINPTEGQGSPGKRFSFYRKHSPPLGILYLSSELEYKGHEVEVIDFSAEEYTSEKILKRINSTDTIGLTVNAYNVNNAIEISNLIKNKDRHLPILIGGPLCSICPEQMLNEINADICLKGEGEKVINKIADAINGTDKLEKIPGVFYKKNSNIIKGPDNIIIKDLDSIKFPARHLVEKYEYGYMAGVCLIEDKFTSIITSRGCPFNCKFCCVGSIYQYYRKRSAENVIKELDELHGKYNHFIIMDDNFFIDLKRAEKIFDILIKRDYGFKIGIMGVRADSSNLKIYKKMKKAGVTSVFMGLESGNQDVLNYYNKRLTIKQIEKSVKLARRAGLVTFGNFIIGAPIEKEKHLNDTYELAKRLHLDQVSFSALRYLKGSDLWDEANKAGKIRDDEFLVQVDPSRGLGNFSYEYLEKWSAKKVKKIMLSPMFIIREFFFTILRKDFVMFKAGFDIVIKKLRGEFKD